MIGEQNWDVHEDESEMSITSRVTELSTALPVSGWMRRTSFDICSSWASDTFHDAGQHPPHSFERRKQIKQLKSGHIVAYSTTLDDSSDDSPVMTVLCSNLSI